MNPQPNNRLVTLPTYLDLVCVYDSSRIYLCNPSIEQLVCLPVESPVYKSSFHQHHVGLGYISSIKKHKLLRIISPDRDSAEHGMDRHCEVFTVGAKNSRWGTVANPPYKIVAHAACVDGVIYMLPHYLGLQPFIPRVCCFDLEKEKWSELQTPCQIHPDNIVHICFVRKVVEECLCLVDFAVLSLALVFFFFNFSLRQWSSEMSRPENSGLSSAMNLLTTKKEIDSYSKGGPLAFADLIQYGAQAAVKKTFLDSAIRKCGGNEEKGRLLYTAYGSTGQEPDPEGRIPQWDKASVQEMKDKFSSIGFGPRQVYSLGTLKWTRDKNEGGSRMLIMPPVLFLSIGIA
ncbi:uncharacterized protein A4U43_C06F10400 [Asparagus officinalis]|uniref:F-box associated beta-propeller type 3 domain-containing protein n=1 Tax=Asparagus officinalis TaxID=4686 RepID=A0A5P1EKW4_ASPOF|nr:uncharacterized protein A4U43_C06F10400 [Asparagus officinalis]